MNSAVQLVRVETMSIITVVWQGQVMTSLQGQADLTYSKTTRDCKCMLCKVHAVFKRKGYHAHSAKRCAAICIADWHVGRRKVRGGERTFRLMLRLRQQLLCEGTDWHHTLRTVGSHLPQPDDAAMQ